MFTATVLKTLSMATASATLMTLGVVSLTSSSVQATPLRLDYTVEAEDEGWFKYDFELSVDNNDGSYEPGNHGVGLYWEMLLLVHPVH